MSYLHTPFTCKRMSYKSSCQAVVSLSSYYRRSNNNPFPIVGTRLLTFLFTLLGSEAIMLIRLQKELMVRQLSLTQEDQWRDLESCHILQERMRRPMSLQKQWGTSLASLKQVQKKFWKSRGRSWYLYLRFEEIHVFSVNYLCKKGVVMKFFLYVHYSKSKLFPFDIKDYSFVHVNIYY